MSWIGGGFWLPMLHVLEDNARSDTLDGRRIWWSRCNHMCVVLPPDLDRSSIRACWTCFPRGIDYLPRSTPNTNGETQETEGTVGQQ